MRPARSRFVHGLTLAIALAGTLTSVPAFGDWLVTTDGSAIQTRGGWEVKGRLVLFHTADGTFSSMRLDSLDLEASESRTEAARTAAASRRRRPDPKPRPRATFILTDKDVGHVDPATLPNPVIDAPDGAAALPEGIESEFTQAADNPLQVASWEAVVEAEAEGVTIEGVVTNPSPFHAANINVKVTIFDLTGEVLAEGPATLDVRALGPDGRSNFEVLFSGIYSVSDAQFAITSFNAIVPDQPEASDDQSIAF
ncbi:MAG: FxLYD domain-containing protein [Thermoanaerobaculia bacterium]